MTSLFFIMADTETLPRLISRRQANRGIITRIFAAIESLRDDEELENKFKVPLIEAQLAQLDAKLAELDEIDHKVQNLTADDALEDVISENEQYILQKQIIKAEIVVYCDNIRPNPPPSVDDTASSVSSRSEYASILSARAPQRYSKLAKLDLPTFDGDIFMWRSFWDSFSSEVDSVPDMPAITKFNYLQAQLRGEALDSIRGYRLQ